MTTHTTFKSVVLKPHSLGELSGVGWPNFSKLLSFGVFRAAFKSAKNLQLGP